MIYLPMRCIENRRFPQAALLDKGILFKRYDGIGSKYKEPADQKQLLFFKAPAAQCYKVYLIGAAFSEHPAAFVHSGSRGEYIVNYKYPFAFDIDIVHCFKSIFDIFLSLLFI